MPSNGFTPKHTPYWSFVTFAMQPYPELRRIVSVGTFLLLGYVFEPNCNFCSGPRQHEHGNFITGRINLDYAETVYHVWWKLSRLTHGWSKGTLGWWSFSIINWIGYLYKKTRSQVVPLEWSEGAELYFVLLFRILNMQIQFQNLFFPPLPLLAAIQVNKNEKALQPLMYYVTCPRRVAEYQLTRWCCLSLFGRDGGTGAATRVHTSSYNNL